MAEYFERFGGVRDYLQAVVRRAVQDGYTATILGRRRYLPDLSSDNRQRREMAERMALNAPIQGSAADIIKVAMLRVDARDQVDRPALPDAPAGPRRAGLRRRARRAGDLEELVRREMGDAYPLSVPLEVSVGSGRDWNGADH